MGSTGIIDAPALQSQSPATDSQWRKEYNAFMRVFLDLLKTHAGRCVAVHNEVVIAVADSFKAAAMDAYKRVGCVPLHVGLVSDVPPRPVPRIG